MPEKHNFLVDECIPVGDVSDAGDGFVQLRVLLIRLVHTARAAFSLGEQLFGNSWATDSESIGLSKAAAITTQCGG